ncbi:POU domain, class 5, transcription factor 2, partial [Carlito syrichta]|uniref:POU domain, class 5, transcription factor 2 n=1 Tax=Carlito syrichta TaxID=1868482 RepID=A0A1U7SKN9_CARSF
PVWVDTPTWLSNQATPGRLVVRPGVCPGPEVWGTPLGPLTNESQGGMGPCGPQPGTGKPGSQLQSLCQGACPGTSVGPCLGPYIVLRSIPTSAPPEDVSAIKSELEQLAEELRRRRMALGYSQADVGCAVGALFGKVLSQTTICRFEARQLSLASMWRLQPLLKMWLQEVGAENLLGLCKMEMILLQVRKSRRASSEKRVRKSLERLFLQCPKPTPQQVSFIARCLWLQKDLVRGWFEDRSKMGPQLTENASPQGSVRAAGPPRPGALACFPSAPLLRFDGPHHGGSHFTPLYSSVPFSVKGAIPHTPASTLGLPRI